jgi:putative membrane protein
MPGWCCGAGGWWMVVWLVLLATLVVVAVLVLRALWGRGGGAGEPAARKGNDALQILEGRYARGEINHEEFEERRRTLRP